VQSRFYAGTDFNPDAVLRELQQFFAMQEHEVQTLQVGSSTVLQARKGSTLTNITGLSSALTVRISPEADGYRVEVGMSEWLDKAAVGVIGYALFWPLIATAAFGFYKQHKLTEDTWRVIEANVTRNQSYYRPPSASSWSGTAVCASCGAPLPQGAAFCSKCGASVAEAPVCPQCGVTNQLGARFCSGCGAKLT